MVVLLLVEEVVHTERSVHHLLLMAMREILNLDQVPRHLLNPSPFSLDRLLAILHSILPHSIVQTGHIASQIATLTSLRLLTKTGGASADLLDPTARFRVNCTWEYVSSLGRSVGFEMRDYLAT